MNLEAVTIQDCLDMYNFKNYAVIIENGRVTGFKAEKSPTDDRESA